MEGQRAAAGDHLPPNRPPAGGGDTDHHSMESMASLLLPLQQHGRPGGAYHPPVDMADASDVDQLFTHAALYSILTWGFLLALSYALVGDDNGESSIRYANASEQHAALFAAGTIGVTTLLLVSPLVLQQRARTGIVLAATLCQFIAFTTNLLLAFAPVPILMDSITKSPVYLVRWCEWIPLAGLMTFLSETIDLSKKKGHLKVSIFMGLTQSLSCVAGFAFPFCQNLLSWSIWMIVAVVTYLFMFPRTWYKMKRCQQQRENRGTTYLSMERYDRVRFAANLMILCTLCWTILVVAYFLNMAAHCGYLEPFMNTSSLPLSFAMKVDTFFDVLAKGIFMKLIVDVHDAVFETTARAQRQLSELRRLMSILWSSSSDVICISVCHNGKVTSMLSPSFLTLVGATLPPDLPLLKDNENKYHSVALMIETQHPADPLSSFASSTGETGEPDEEKVLSAYYVDSSEIPYAGSLRHSILTKLTLRSPQVQCAHEIVNVAVHRFRLSQQQQQHGNVEATRHQIIVQPLSRVNGEECHVEIKVSTHADHAFVAVVRDVTERCRLFDAETKARSEAVQRQRDAQTVNRFTRHEVKNGLLAGIELVDSLRNKFEELEKSLPDDVGSASSSSTAASKNVISEMDNMLHEILDTVLSEAMARDVIHEVYQPRLETLDVKGVLTSCNVGLGVHPRFPLEVRGALPYMLLDSQLLRYIHRNAFSNACKYGKADGTVLTILEYDRPISLLEMKVVNEAGIGHEELVDMGPLACEAVFREGTRLHEGKVEDDHESVSSGDGAWIMQKCAKTLGGSCRISFERSRTVFTFCCPAEALEVSELPSTEDFEVPEGTWGIAVDDSVIQRRLMNRILSHAGVDESRRVIIGKDRPDVYRLEGIVRKILHDDPSCKILILVDENLDFEQRDTTHIIISGSMITQDILFRLLPSERARVFALVRSANDSTEDVLLYTERCHGFFPKVPMQRDRVREILAPLWAEFFFANNVKPETLADDLPEQDEGGNETGDAAALKDELLESVNRVDRYLKDKPFGDVPWDRLWSALHSLKGDLLVIEGSPDLEMACMLLSSMRGPTAPPEFPTKWSLIRELVMKELNALEQDPSRVAAGETGTVE